MLGLLFCFKGDYSTMEKLKEMIKLSDEILEDIEGHKLSLEDVILKCKKLARLKEDNEAQNWFYLELNGYKVENLPSFIKEENLLDYARIAGRNTFHNDVSGKKIENYYFPSISEVETQINNDIKRLDSLKLPESYTPAVRKHAQGEGMLPATSWEEPIETLSLVLNNIEAKKTTLSETIKNYKSLLSRIKNNIYQYVLNINVQLKFEDVMENIFQKARTKVDDMIRKISPDVVRNLLVAFDRLGEKPEEWTQALNSCRLAIKAFSDVVFSPSDSKYKMKDGASIEVKDVNFKNRLYAFIDTSSKSTQRRFLLSRTDDLCNRVNVLCDFLSKGFHKELAKKDVEMCLINTYLLLSDLIDLKNS